LANEEERRQVNLRDHIAWRLGLEDYHQLAHGDLASELPLEASRAVLMQMEKDGWLISRHLQHENWGMVWGTMGFWLRTCTTVVLTAAVVYLTVLFSSLVGYCLARQRFPGKPVVIAVVLIAALNVVPSEAVMVPIFLFLRDVQLLGTLWAPGLWMVGATASSALLMAAFFLSLPKEVEEAAFVDGAGPVRTFFSIALPMAQPMVATIALFAFLGAWNNFMIPLLTTIAHPHLQPLAVAVYDFRGGHAHAWELINAAAAIMVLPVIILFVFLQKRIVAAVAAGAVKG
ncbi:MAG: carbohydrate ABC transporter permease, partial [Planctomycetota bacterium]